MSSDTSRLLAARQLAGLRRAGWTTLDAVDFVCAAIRDARTVADLSSAAAFLREGASGTAPSGDALVQLCAKGESAAPESFDALAESLEARIHAQSAARGVRRLAWFFFCGPLLLGTFAAWFITPQMGTAFASAAALGGELAAPDLPWVSSFVFGALEVLRYVGLPLAVAVAVFVPFALKKLSPGRREFESAARLFELASGSATDFTARELLAPEEAYFTWRRSTANERTAAVDLGTALVTSGRARVRAFQWVAPLFGAMAFALLLWMAILPLFLPIFSVTRGMK